MMRPVLLLIFWMVFSALFGGPIPIQPVTHEIHDAYYYARQVEEWKVMTTEGSCNQDAWYHYYMAAHYANLFGYEPAFDLDAIHQGAEENLTEADFALHYLRCREAPDEAGRWTSLLAAHKADRSREEALPGLILFHELQRDFAKRDSFLRRILQVNPYPRGVLEWNYNQLQSTTENAILITHGDTDTYPSWALQAMGIRSDILVVNMSLLVYNPDYRKLVFGELQLPVPTAEPEAIFEALTQSNRPVFYGIGGNQSFIADRADDMYLTGLAFYYSPEPGFNNLGALLKNYENHWRLEDLQEPLGIGARQQVAKQLNQNYLPALLELWHHYQDNNPVALLEVDRLLRDIADRNDIGEAIGTFLTGEFPQLASATPGLTARQIEKGLVEIPGGRIQIGPREDIKIRKGLRMGITEVSNASYQLFLEDLLRQRLFPYLDTAAIEETDWASFLPDSIQRLPVNELYKRGHPSVDNHPITNISHQAAVLYCQWLTQVYNQDPKRKIKGNVRFRLPTQEEFTYAAAGGKQGVPFPWGGFYIMNARRCYLANFNSTLPHNTARQVALFVEQYTGKSFAPKDLPSAPYMDDQTGGDCNDDGGFLTVPVDSYHPNDFNLYQMSGNAAEMIDQNGRSMGGSWLDPADHMIIGTVQYRELPHPAVGFRVVMERID